MKSELTPTHQANFNRQQLAIIGGAGVLAGIITGALQNSERAPESVEAIPPTSCFDAQYLRVAMSQDGVIQALVDRNASPTLEASTRFLPTNTSLCETEDRTLQETCEESVPSLIEMLIGQEVKTEYTPATIITYTEPGYDSEVTTERFARIGDHQITIPFSKHTITEHIPAETVEMQTSPATCEITL